MRFFLLSSLLLLSSCAYIFNHETAQEIDVSFATPQPTKALCSFETKEFKKNVWVPSVTLIQKSDEPLDIFCTTAAGRVFVQTVKPRRVTSSYLNIFNGFYPGDTYDKLSRTSHAYPDQIIVDFDAKIEAIVPVDPPLAYGDLDVDTRPVEADLSTTVDGLDFISPDGTYISRDNSR